LGRPSWSDKLWQAVRRSLLEAYDAPPLSDPSHGFRPGRGGQTPLQTGQETWPGTPWDIEGDSAQGCERMDPQVLRSIRRAKRLAQRFLRLVQPLLQAGSREHGHAHTPLRGTPQGASVSPRLRNLSVDNLDKYVAGARLPAYTRGQERQKHRRYVALRTPADKRRTPGRLDAAEARTKEAQQLPTVAPYAPAYRRLPSLRYADDWLLGLGGPKAAAEASKAPLQAFLHAPLKLELSQAKTLLPHAPTGAARFLGYAIGPHPNDAQRDPAGHRTRNGPIGLRFPSAVVAKKRARSMRGGKVLPRPALLGNADAPIVQPYQTEYRGLVQDDLLAQHVAWLWRLHGVRQTSRLKTLAATPKRCLAVVVEREGRKPRVARFGGIPLRRRKEGIRLARAPPPVYLRRQEFSKRLLAGACALWASTTAGAVHQVRKLADLKTSGRAEKPLWIRGMASRRRPTLVVCRRCHEAIHTGRPLPQRVSAYITGQRCEAKVSRTVGREADGKGLPQESLAGGPPYPMPLGQWRASGDSVSAPGGPVAQASGRPRRPRRVQHRAMSAGKA
jgi:hypothetical protein